MNTHSFPPDERDGEIESRELPPHYIDLRDIERVVVVPLPAADDYGEEGWLPDDDEWSTDLL